MKKETSDKLFAAWAWCDHQDKSTEFMIEFMKDEANVDHDTVMKFIESNSGTTTTISDARKQWYEENSDWLLKWKLTHKIYDTEELDNDTDSLDVFQIFLSDMQRRFFEKLDTKTGWGKEQVKECYCQAEIEAFRMMADSIVMN